MKDLLTALGVQTKEEALRVIAETGKVLASLKEATGKSDLPAAVAHMAELRGTAGAVAELTGRPGLKEALGVVSGWKDSAAAGAKAQADLAALQQSNRDSEAKALLDAAQDDGRLRPAARERVEGYYKEHGLAFVKAHLEALTPAVPVGRNDTRQQPDQSKTPTLLTADEQAVCKALGMSEAEFRKNKEAAEAASA